MKSTDRVLNLVLFVFFSQLRTDIKTDINCPLCWTLLCIIYFVDVSIKDPLWDLLKSLISIFFS